MTLEDSFTTPKDSVTTSENPFSTLFDRLNKIYFIKVSILPLSQPQKIHKNTNVSRLWFNHILNHPHLYFFPSVGSH